MWAIGAVAVTIPSCYYILTTIDTGGHGHDEHGEGHGGEHGENHEEEGKDEDGEEKSDDSGETRLMRNLMILRVLTVEMRRKQILRRLQMMKEKTILRARTPRSIFLMPKEVQRRE